MKYKTWNVKHVQITYNICANLLKLKKKHKFKITSVRAIAGRRYETVVADTARMHSLRRRRR